MKWIFKYKGELPTLNEMISDNKVRYSRSGKKIQTAYGKKKNEFTQDIAMQAKHVQKLKPIDVQVDCYFHWVCKDKRKDKDNTSVSGKYIFDGLVKAGILPNDGWNYIGSILHTFSIDKNSPCVTLTMTPTKVQK